MSELTIARFWVRHDEVPPSINGLYTRGPGGRRILSKEGLRFKANLTSTVAAGLPHDWGKIILAAHTIPAKVIFDIALFHPNFYNHSWKPGGRTAKGSLQTPYQKLDATNYIKITEDAVVAATGIDDCMHLCASITKAFADPGYIIIHYEVEKDLEWQRSSSLSATTSPTTRGSPRATPRAPSSASKKKAASTTELKKEGVVW